MLSCTPDDTELLRGRLDQAPPVHLDASVLTWQEDLLGLGLASFAPDCFSARGIARTVEDQGLLPQLAMVVDAFRCGSP